MNAPMTGSIVVVFAFLALERADHQREAAGVGEQPDGDLRLQAALLGEPRPTEPIPGIGLETRVGS